MPKVLFADNSTVLPSILKKLLPPDYQLRLCRDGDDALEYIRRYRPDALIINLMLPHLDGLGVLQEAAYRPRAIIAITSYTTRYIQQALYTLGADYMMVSPEPKALLMRLEDLLSRQIVLPNANSEADYIQGYLHRLGIPAHLDGFQQLCVALPLFAADPGQLLTKELYPAVARVCGCKDARSVEHSIRKAIHAAWTHRNDRIWSKFFAPGPRGIIPCPTNKAFLSRLAVLLNQEE